MPTKNATPTTTLRHITEREWAIIKLMRTNATTEAEMVQVPRAYYEVLQHVTNGLGEIAQRISGHAYTLEYLTMQTRVAS